jgi:hypothetical protein
MMTTTTHLVALPVALEVTPWIFQRMSPRRRQWLRRLGNIIQSVFVVFYDIPNYTHGIRRTFRYCPSHCDALILKIQEGTYLPSIQKGSAGHVRKKRRHNCLDEQGIEPWTTPRRFCSR